MVRNAKSAWHDLENDVTGHRSWGGMITKFSEGTSNWLKGGYRKFRGDRPVNMRVIFEKKRGGGVRSTPLHMRELRPHIAHNMPCIGGLISRFRTKTSKTPAYRQNISAIDERGERRLFKSIHSCLYCVVTTQYKREWILLARAWLRSQPNTVDWGGRFSPG